MRTVSARQANHEFSELLSRVESGEEIVQDGFVLQDVRFVNPFERANDRLIDKILPPS